MVRIIYTDRWPNRACQKLLLFDKKTHSVWINVSQETVILMVKYKSLIAVCGFTTKLSRFVSVSVSAGPRAVSEASVGLGASHRVPQKNKWVSCLSVVRYWVSGLECGQCAKVAGRGEYSLVFLTWWDGLRGEIGEIFFFFFNLFYVQLHKHTDENVLHNSSLLLMFSVNTGILQGTYSACATSHLL